MLDQNRCVGRDREIAEIADLRTAADQGGQILILTGPTGVGKTTLLRRLAAEWPNTRWAQGAPWETDLPGGVLSQLLQEDPPEEPVAAAAFMVDRLVGLGPTVLLIDDAEHADLTSLQAISTLLRYQRELPVLVLAAAATEVPVLGELADARALTGLDAGAVAELARRHGISLHPALAAALTRHTGGNPRDVLALLTEAPAATWSRPESALPAPAYRTELVAGQLAGCGPQARALVEALAVLGDDATLAEVAAQADLDDPVPAIDAAAAAGLLAPQPHFEPRLADGLTRAAVLEVMGVTKVRDAHQRAAGLITDPARQIGHRVAATPTPDPGLADEVDALARRCGADGAWAQAARLFRDASRLTPDPLLRDQRLTLAVDALIADGDCGAAAVMVPAVESLRETPLRNAVLAYLAILRGRGTEAEVRLQRAGDIVNADRDPQIAALIAQRWVLHSLIRCRGAELVHWADRALALADPDSPAGIESAAIRGLGQLAAGHPHSAVRAYDELAQRVRHGAQAQRITMGRGWVRLITDDVDGARSDLESAVATANLGGSRRITLWALGWLARVHFVAGDWDDALATVVRGRELVRATGIEVVTPLLEWTAAQVHALRGDSAAAEAAVRAADASTTDYEMMRIPVMLARAQIAEAEADYPRVRRELTPLIRMAPGTSLAEPGYWHWPDVLANALALDGQPEDVDVFLRPHEERAKARKHRSAQARLGCARGRVLGAQGDLPAARAKFEEALQLLDGLPLRYDAARVNFAYGQTLRRAGKRREADAVIGTARELYLSLGAQAYVVRCDRELKAGGLNQERGSRDSVELTAQEEAVSALVAQGLSNREVAAELYVSTKTVQYHLTRIYAKLGIRSRAELAALRR